MREESTTTIVDYWHTMMTDLCDIPALLFLILFVVLAAVVFCAHVINSRRRHVTSGEEAAGSGNVVPESVNFHFTRRCNYKCGFCFHTAKTSHLLPIDDAKRGLKRLKEAGEGQLMGRSRQFTGCPTACQLLRSVNRD